MGVPHQAVRDRIGNRKITKEIFVPGQIINIVTSQDDEGGRKEVMPGRDSMCSNTGTRACPK